MPALRRSADRPGRLERAGRRPAAADWRCSSATRSHTTWPGCSAQARQWGIDLAPHGKTTMSPQLFTRQLDAGAWGLTFATVNQLARRRGGRRAPHADRQPGAWPTPTSAIIQMLRREHADLRVAFLVDSPAQLALIETWAERHPGSVPFEVMLEIGIAGGRTGCRTQDEALALARAPARQHGGQPGRHRVLRRPRRQGQQRSRRALRAGPDGPRRSRSPGIATRTACSTPTRCCCRPAARRSSTWWPRA